LGLVSYLVTKGKLVGFSVHEFDKFDVLHADEIWIVW